MKKILIIVMSVLFLFQGLNAQQDPQYSLYQFNQMIINPAYAGARDALAIIALRRDQWVGFPGAPKTMVLSIHAPIANKNIGIGLSVVRDDIGPRSTTGFYGNFAYILKLNQKFKLSFGLNGGYNSYNFNFDEIDFKKDEVPAELSKNLTKGTLDINAGLFLRSKSFFVGFSASHINSPKVYSYETASINQGKFTYKEFTHLFFSLGNSFVFSENLVFAPTILLKQVKSDFGMDINCNFFLYKRLWLGAFYRSEYGPGALVQFYATDKLRFGLSYDTGLGNASKLGSSFEVMIGFDFAPTKAKMINPRFL
ncbi:PorP/SprF family type IX secretion system membrane protein [Aurantibacillus circumpalustris]|uniref:PorP/SprF family type IX secretion system membrane protein n=1 Tax=Aurantibacillus circumpalustris TaxID=3036359 RepID=UPI00295B8D79|nr:type IX secretion system membrane protein PorP/SprF [Aurantibacillus circumpalustris]